MAHIDELSKYITPKRETITMRSYRIKDSNIRKLDQLMDVLDTNQSAIINALIEQAHDDSFED
jgi:hypothetical protein